MATLKLIESNPPKGHGRDDIKRHQRQSTKRVNKWSEREDHAMERMEAARTEKTRTKWRDALIYSQRWRVRAEEDVYKYMEEEIQYETRRARRLREPPPVLPPRRPPPRPRPRKWEYVIKKDYKASKPTGTSNVFFDIRAWKEDGTKATHDQLRSLAGHLKMGEIPEGWEIRAIKWGRGERADPEQEPEREGENPEQAIKDFAPIIQSLGLSAGEIEMGEEPVDE